MCGCSAFTFMKNIKSTMFFVNTILKNILLFAALFYFLPAFISPLIAQKTNKKEDDDLIYLFKKDWTGAASIEEAAYFMQVTKQSDSAFIARSYNKNGPMVKQESFSDVDLTMPNGRFCWYNEQGKLDSTGWVKSGKKDGSWVYYRDAKTYLTIRYNAGKFIDKSDYDAGLFTDADGTTMPLEEKRISDSLAMLAIDTIKTVQVEAKYKSGAKEWQKYISDNLKTPDRFMNVMGKGRYTAVIVFMVDKEGKVDRDFFLMKSCEWSADAEVFRIIQESPKWQPAIQNGKNVFYRQKQSITFEIN